MRKEKQEIHLISIAFSCESRRENHKRNLIILKLREVQSTLCWTALSADCDVTKALNILHFE